MNVEILNTLENIESDLVSDALLYYDNLKINKSDLERFCRKIIRDENESIFSKYVLSIKIDSTVCTYKELILRGYNLSKPQIDPNLNFSLPKKLQKNEKIQNSIITYLKNIYKIYQDNNSKSIFLDFDILSLLPQICNISYIKNGNLMNLMNLCTLKEYNNTSAELVLLSSEIFEELNKLLPFFFNPITYKVFLKHKKV